MSQRWEGCSGGSLTRMQSRRPHPTRSAKAKQERECASSEGGLTKVRVQGVRLWDLRFRDGVIMI